MTNHQEFRSLNFGIGRTEDCLRARLRRMVQTLMQDRRKDCFCGIKFLLNAAHPVILKVIWMVVLVLCLLLFLYQTCDRISFYFTYPVTTDVLITKKQYQILPDITICYQESDAMFQIYDPFSTDGKCVPVPVSSLLKNATTRSIKEVWKRINTTQHIISAKQYSEREEDLSFKNVPLIYGTCTTFSSKTNKLVLTDRGRIEIILKVYSNYTCSQKSKSPVFVHDAGDFPLSSKLHIHGVGGRDETAITVKQVNFLNRTGNLCVSNTDFKNCIEECFASFTLKHGECRFPFHSKRINLKPCEFSSRTYDLWKKMQLYLTGDTAAENCTCSRKCQHRIFYIKQTRKDSRGNQDEHVMYFNDPHETIIRERLIYDTIKLLSDIGGNSGLFIGLSILSIFNIVHTSLGPVKRKVTHFSMTDPLYKKVIKTYNEFNELIVSRRETPAGVHLIKRFSASGILQMFVLVFGLSMFLYAVVNRASYYLKYPTRNIVDISFNTTLDFPSVTICTGDPKVFDLQKKYAQLYNVKDYCEVKIWQLLDLPGVNATSIWVNKNIANGKNFWRPFKHVVLPDGTCIDLDDDKNPAPAGRNSWMAADMPSLCGTNYHKVYIRPSTKTYDYFLYRFIMQQHVHQISFIIKEINTDNTFKPCITEEEHEKCMYHCLIKKLWQRVHCRLPYMPQSKLSMCKSSNQGKHSHLAYLELFGLPSSGQDCNCLPPCRKRFYETTVSTEEQNWLSFSFGASHNVIESYSQQPSYLIVQFLGDIGGWLGSTLGLCLLTTVEAVLSACSFLLRSRCKGIQ